MNQVTAEREAFVPAAEVSARAAELVAAIRAGDRRALARTLSIAERRGALAAEVQRCAAAVSDNSYAVGVTGPPGSGKSTLVASVIDVLRRSEKSVAALAVDPSSPLSGGAVLGDRIRMQRHAIDRGAFIRSVASQGQSGGLALSTPSAIRLVGLAGFDWVLIETVGIGQVEIDVAKTADTTIVVVNPGGGDDVQATKGGLLEIADILVVNKADREGARKTRSELVQMLGMSRMLDEGWVPPVLMTVADTGEGVDDLWAAVEKHREHLTTSGQLPARRLRRGEVEVHAAMSMVIDGLLSAPETRPALDDLYDAVARGELDAFAAVFWLLEGAVPGKSDR